ncbi:hypothetical protein Pcinc_037178, partial [Petrolisthes cinctipes]
QEDKTRGPSKSLDKNTRILVCLSRRPPPGRWTLDFSWTTPEVWTLIGRPEVWTFLGLPEVWTFLGRPRGMDSSRTTPRYGPIKRHQFISDSWVVFMKMLVVLMLR